MTRILLPTVAAEGVAKNLSSSALKDITYGSAALSFFAPQKHVPEHRGPFRGVIRYYLVDCNG